MNVHIPQWVLAAFVGAAPMLGIVFFILFSCTLLGLVQRCKISLSKSHANRRKTEANDSCLIENENLHSSILFNPISNTIIISPFDDIPMKDIDAESSSKAYSEPKGYLFHYPLYFNILFYFVVSFLIDLSNSSKKRSHRSTDASIAGSDYDNGSSSIFTDNDYEQDRLSLIETSSQRKLGIKQTKTPDTIVHV